jgi:hypothetical protein
MDELDEVRAICELTRWVGKLSSIYICTSMLYQVEELKLSHDKLDELEEL